MTPGRKKAIERTKESGRLPSRFNSSRANFHLESSLCQTLCFKKFQSVKKNHLFHVTYENINNPIFAERQII